jgi:hypothetical protein
MFFEINEFLNPQNRKCDLNLGLGLRFLSDPWCGTKRNTINRRSCAGSVTEVRRAFGEFSNWCDFYA